MSLGVHGETVCQESLTLRPLWSHKADAGLWTVACVYLVGACWWPSWESFLRDLWRDKETAHAHHGCPMRLNMSFGVTLGAGMSAGVGKFGQVMENAQPISVQETSWRLFTNKWVQCGGMIWSQEKLGVDDSVRKHGVWGLPQALGWGSGQGWLLQK